MHNNSENYTAITKAWQPPSYEKEPGADKPLASGGNKRQYHPNATRRHCNDGNISQNMAGV
jgi:hypothetical protein